MRGFSHPERRGPINREHPFVPTNESKHLFRRRRHSRPNMSIELARTCASTQSRELAKFRCVYTISVLEETRGTSTPNVPLIKLGTRFECSLPRSLDNFVLGQNRVRAYAELSYRLTHTWVAITRVLFECALESLVVRIPELARGTIARGNYF